MRLLLNSIATFAALTLCSTKAFAGPGGIVFGPNAANSIPTIPGTMMVVLGLILAFIAFKILKEKSSSSTFF